MRMPYSRLSSVEERKNIKNAMLFVVSTIVLIALIFFVGIPFLGRFAAFVSDFGKSNKPIASQDATPPAPPRFNQFPDFTNQKSITLSGASEPAATVKLTFNSKEESALADIDGNFSFDLDLNDGENTFSATAVDTAGNTSQESKEYKITFDNKAPNLTIDSPSDGTSFFGSQQKQVTIRGTTDSTAQITINDRVISVDGDGKFQYTTTLNDGENKFNVKSSDQAGNTTEKSLTLNFTS